VAESKTHQRFRSRAAQLELHLEAMDAAARITFNILGRKSNEGKNIDEALPIKCENYSRLNHPVKDKARIFNYSRSKNTLSAIVEIFGYFSEYMRDILKEIYEKDPMKVVSQSNKMLTLKFSDIAKFTSLQELHAKMVEDIFRNLENERSTVKLIDKIINGFGLNISNAEKEVVLPFLELRHLIIHNNAKIDAAFEKKYGAKLSVKAGDKVPSQFSVANDAIKHTSTFLKSIDNELILLDMVATL
jgi:hypothetical protein